MKSILLIDDDEVIAEIIQYYLAQKNKYRVVWAKNAAEGLAACRDRFDLILLDVKLPDVNGIMLCATLRKHTRCPILLISCIDDKSFIISGLQNGADDYITKPFDCDELNARIESHLRRSELYDGPVSQELFEQPGFSIDMSLKRVIRNNREYELTPTEYSILMYFINHAEKCITAEELYAYIWNEPYYSELRTIVVHISNLRKKIGDGEGEYSYIHSLRGVGYFYRPEKVGNNTSMSDKEEI